MDPGTILAIIGLAETVVRLSSEYISGVKDARKDVERLSEAVKNIHSILLRIEEIAKGLDSAKLPALGTAFTAIEKSFQELKEKLNPKTSQKLMKRVGLRALKWPFTKEEVAGYMTRLERDKASLNVALNADQINFIIDIDKRVTEIKHDQDIAGQDRLLAKLAYAYGAAFNSHHRENEPKCVPNTRVNLLRELREWSTNPKTPIFWLNGMAGMGKSTIARTIANTFSENGSLGASFFFSRGTGDLGHAKKFVTTVAFQLAHSSALIRTHICDAIALNDITTFQGNLRDQWKKLILGPLTKLTIPNNLGLTLVVDALDECDNEEHIKTILQLFVEAENLTAVNFKVLVTSRPETQIRIGFENMPQIKYHDLALHNIPRSIVENDISVYLEYELSEVRREQKLTSQWPGEDRFKLLVQKTDCVFIYIATACLFIRDQNWHPDEQLSIVLREDLTEDDKEDLSTAKLDSMYTQVLKQSVFKNKPGKQSRLSERFEEIVGSIVVLYDVLPAQGLAVLLSKSNEEIDSTLRSLHSVLNIPKNALDPIRLLHPSFRDFLLDMRRCRDIDIRIEEAQIHENLTQGCLRVSGTSIRV